MSSEWDTLPLLPLKCILQQLSTKDALSAMSTCTHWRTAVLLYEGHRETLKLRVKQFEKSLFVTRVFRKHVRALHIHLDGSENEMDKFMDYVLPQFLDTEALRELVFIGPNYRQHSQTNRPVVKLNRLIPDSLLYRHRQSLTRFALLGCALDSVNTDNDNYIQNMEFNSRVLKYSKAQLCGETLLCNNLHLALLHLIIDYEQLPTKSSLGLIHSACLRRVTLNVNQTPSQKLRLPFCDTTEVGVNIIGLPYKRFGEVIENVLVEDLQLVSLKVMFCDAIHAALIKHVVGRYKSTLRQLVWSDRPSANRPPLIVPDEGNTCNVNPFIVLCWQCTNLRRLVIHGYWLWQYDLLGFVRLRSSLEQLEVSSVYAKQTRGVGSEQTTFRVQSSDGYKKLDGQYVDVILDTSRVQCLMIPMQMRIVPDAKYSSIHYNVQINQHTQFPWRPIPWSRLHAGLSPRATAAQRTDYLVTEIFNYSAVPL